MISTRSSAKSQCVEVAELNGASAVRDSKHPVGPLLIFTQPSRLRSPQASATASLTRRLPRQQPADFADCCAALRVWQGWQHRTEEGGFMRRIKLVRIQKPKGSTAVAAN
ncbi:MAG: DUF397 domain-containing protein [Pseudonocardiaceae bacterium]